MTRRLLTTWILLVFILSACASTEKSVAKIHPPAEAAGISITALENGSDQILFAGKVQDVIDGKITETANRRFVAADFKAVFEAGTPGEVNSLGEFIAINGTAYGRNTDPQAETYFKTVSSGDFVTTCAAFIPRQARPSYVASYSPENGGPMTASDVYTSLQKAVDKPYCFSGLAVFEKLEAVAVGRAPIFKENLFENKASYYPRSIEAQENVHAYLMGCVGDFSKPMDAEFKKDLERILYNNPFDTGSVSSHTHLLTLKHHVRKVEDVKPEIADSVSHLLSQSKISEFHLDIYPIGQLTAVLAANHK